MQSAGILTNVMNRWAVLGFERLPQDPRFLVIRQPDDLSLFPQAPKGIVYPFDPLTARQNGEIRDFARALMTPDDLCQRINLKTHEMTVMFGDKNLPYTVMPLSIKPPHALTTLQRTLESMFEQAVGYKPSSTFLQVNMTVEFRHSHECPTATFPQNGNPTIGYKGSARYSFPANALTIFKAGFEHSSDPAPSSLENPRVVFVMS